VIAVASLLREIPDKLPGELTETLCEAEHLRIERIISRGHASPPGFWYDQPEHEFVLLVSGRARLAFADGSPPVELVPANWLIIPAHKKHRVEWTDPEQDSVWLAVHYQAPGEDALR